jgi:hypothetical protein
MNTIRLEKGIIHLMLPFRMGSAGSPLSIDADNEIWTKTDEDIPKLDYLLEHVKDFFTKNTFVGKGDIASCLIMKLKKDSLPVKMFNNKAYWLSNKSFDNQDSLKNVQNYPVNIDASTFRIIIHPLARVALLVFSIELVKSGKTDYYPNLEDFVKMNYLIRLFNRPNEAFLISQNDRAEERTKAKNLLTEKSSDLFDNVEQADVVIAGWRPRQLINFLLHDFNVQYKVELFDNNRFSPVCYVQTTEEIPEETSIQLALFYLRKLYDFNYTPSPGILQSNDELLHPFKQIYYSTSLEGAVVFNHATSSDPEFLKSFYSNSFQKSIWLNILGCLQRSIFLQLLKEVSNIEPDDHQMIKEYFRRYTSITLKAIFSKVSVYHQHNDYYNLIIHNLQISELQSELKDELYELNNLQRQFHEDEVEKNDEIEKRYDKKMNMILFVLSIFSLSELIYTVFSNENLTILQHSVILGFIFWKLLSLRK